MGTLVTTTGSGQGCGNTWPFCRGQIVPGVITIAGVIEYSHRIQASVVGMLVLTLTVAVWLVYKKDSRAKLLAFLSILFVIVQGVLGALTVIFEGTFNKDWLLSIHFGLSLLALAFVLLLTIRLFQIDKEAKGITSTSTKSTPVLRAAVWGLTVYTYVIVYTGALVQHTGAILGCGYQFPRCGSTYFPSFTSLAGIQMLHRYAAGSIWLLMLGFLVLVMSRHRNRRDVVGGAWWALVFITLQAISGMTLVFTGGQLLVEIAHVTLVSTFFSILSYLCMQVGWFPKSHAAEGAAGASLLEPTNAETESALSS